MVRQWLIYCLPITAGTIRGKIISLGDLHILQRSRGQSTRKYYDVDRMFLITGPIYLRENWESSNSRIGVKSLRIHRDCYR
ncbi:hypothetical protein EDC04DRAFT_2648727 [Pisolithus marmoratus]|nr:hypothetical protein EDC04DRAFT_2648727 [Pisolithus marmoratus]